MNAAHIRKRNESVTQMWHCLAGAEFSAWVLSGLHLSGYNFLPLLVLSLFALCLVIAALLHYVVACEHYASAKGNKKPFESAGMAFLFSLFVSFLFIGLAVTHHAFGTAYFGVPLAFALGALPLQCLRDRC